MKEKKRGKGIKKIRKKKKRHSTDCLYTSKTSHDSSFKVFIKHLSVMPNW